MDYELKPPPVAADQDDLVSQLKEEADSIAETVSEEKWPEVGLMRAAAAALIAKDEEITKLRDQLAAQDAEIARLNDEQHAYGYAEICLLRDKLAKAREALGKIARSDDNRGCTWDSEIAIRALIPQEGERGVIDK